MTISSGISPLERNWKWFVPVGCLGGLVMMAGFAAAIVGFVFWIIQSTEPYEEALARVRGTSAIVNELGEPIAPGFWVSGQIHTTAASGDADLAFPINGPRGEGRVYLVASKRAGRWKFELLEVEIDGRAERIDLLLDPAVKTQANP